MKTYILLISLLILSFAIKAENPYRTYLDAKAQNQFYFHTTSTELLIQKNQTIPHYQIPTGAVFCRLEDKLSRATKVWIKIGVK